MVILIVALMGSVCGEEGMSNDAIVDRIEAEIVPGMHRSVVEQKLTELPVEYVYVSREHLEMIEQTTNGDVELSGRFDVSTQYEKRGIGLSRVAIFVDLDEQERVVEVRTQRVRTGL